MSPEQQQRIGLLVEGWMENLNKKHRNIGARFFYNHTNRPGIPFTLSEKAPPGESWPDGNKFRDHGGPTWRQLEVLAETSSSEEEFRARLTDLVIHKKDSTGTIDAHGLVTQSAVEQIARKALMDVLSKIGAGKMTVDQAIADTKANFEASHVPSGIQATDNKRVPKAKEEKLEREAEDARNMLAMWSSRARTLGLDPPRLTASGAIDMRWLRRAEPAWADHVAKQQKPAEVQDESPVEEEVAAESPPEENLAELANLGD